MPNLHYLTITWPMDDHAKSNSLTIATLTLKSTTAFQFHHKEQLGNRKIIHLTTIFGKWLNDRQITHSKHLWKNDLVAAKSLFWNCSSRWPSTCQINNLKPLWENNLATIRMSSRNNSKKWFGGHQIVILKVAGKDDLVVTKSSFRK